MVPGEASRRRAHRGLPRDPPDLMARWGRPGRGRSNRFGWARYRRPL